MLTLWQDPKLKNKVMKYVILVMVTLSFGPVSCGDDDNGANKEIGANEVPSVVKNTFHKQFPNSTDVDWETFGNGYEVDFEVDAIDHTAMIAVEGNMVKYRFDIGAPALPEAVTAKIVADYENRSVDGSEILKIGDNTYYQVELDDGPNDLRLVFNENGEVDTEVKYYE